MSFLCLLSPTYKEVSNPHNKTVFNFGSIVHSCPFTINPIAALYFKKCKRFVIFLLLRVRKNQQVEHCTLQFGSLCTITTQTIQYAFPCDCRIIPCAWEMPSPHSQLMTTSHSFQGKTCSEVVCICCYCTPTMDFLVGLSPKYLPGMLSFQNLTISGQSRPFTSGCKIIRRFKSNYITLQSFPETKQ